MQQFEPPLADGRDEPIERSDEDAEDARAPLDARAPFDAELELWILAGST